MIKEIIRGVYVREMSSSDVAVEEINSDTTTKDCWVHLRTLGCISAVSRRANSFKVSYQTQLNQPLFLFVAHPEHSVLAISDTSYKNKSSLGALSFFAFI